MRKREGKTMNATNTSLSRNTVGLATESSAVGLFCTTAARGESNQLQNSNSLSALKPC